MTGTAAAYADEADQQVTTPLSVSVENVTLKEVFTDIERQSTYVFIYSDEVGKMLSRRVSVKVDTLSDSVLQKSLPPLPLFISFQPHKVDV